MPSRDPVARETSISLQPTTGSGTPAPTVTLSDPNTSRTPTPDPALSARGLAEAVGGGCVAAVVLPAARDSAITAANTVAPTRATNIRRRRSIARRRADRVLWPCRVGVIAVMLRRCDRTQEPAA